MKGNTSEKNNPVLTFEGKKYNINDLVNYIETFFK